MSPPATEGIGPRWIATGLRHVLFVVAAAAALTAMLFAVASLPEPDRNPHSPEFGWLRSEWALSFAIATVLLGAAIALSSGRVRFGLIGLLLVTWASGIEPAIEYYRERIVPNLCGSTMECRWTIRSH
jgi:hypothetical protein